MPAADVRLRVEEGDRLVLTGLFRATPGARHAGYLEGARQFSLDGRPFALVVDGFCATTGRRPPCTCDGDMRRVNTKDAVFFEVVKGPEAARLGCADGVLIVRTRRDPDVCRDHSTSSTRRPEFCRNDPDRDLRSGPDRARE